MKVAIIGKGMGSVIQACALLKYNHEVEIFFDPDVPPISVGESSTPHFPTLIKGVLGVDMNDVIDDGAASLKRGAVFLNWGKGIPFVHGFGGHPPDGNSGIGSFHFDTVIMNKYINDALEKKGVVYHPEKVVDLKEDDKYVFVNGKKYDFVVNCTGWNFDDKLSVTPQFTTVNAGYLYRDSDFSITKDLTIFKATEDGWEFGLPFPNENIVRHGYLFNTKYSSPEEIEKKLTDQGKGGGRIFVWKPRKSKCLLESNRVAANGNRLFFNEPLQAYSVLMYVEFAYNICEYLSVGINNLTRNATNLKYRRLLINYEQELAWHYQYGSTFDSPFWNDITKQAREVMYYHPSGSISDINTVIETGELGIKSIQRIFMHSREDLVYVHKWMLDMWTDEDRPDIKF